MTHWWDRTDREENVNLNQPSISKDAFRSTYQIDRDYKFDISILQYSSAIHYNVDLLECVQNDFVCLLENVSFGDIGH